MKMVVSKTSTTTGRRRLRRRFPEANNVCVVRRTGVQKCTGNGGGHIVPMDGMPAVDNWRRIATVQSSRRR
jgi:hypothetical protein